MSCCQKILDAASKTTDCVCTPTSFPFVCQRHGGCLKTQHFHGLCRSRADYFDLWERAEGPCLNQPPPGRRPIGLGDAVAWLIRIATFGRVKPWPGCGCAKRKAWLNRVRLWPIPWPSWIPRRRKS